MLEKQRQRIESIKEQTWTLLSVVMLIFLKFPDVTDDFIDLIARQAQNLSTSILLLKIIKDN